MEKFLTVKDLSETLSVKRMTIYGWVHDGIIPYVKMGNLVRFRPSEIEKWLKKRSRNPEAKKEAEPVPISLEG